MHHPKIEKSLESVDNLYPLDEFNRELASNVRPIDWHNPDPQSRYNLVIIGAGTAGLVTAAGAVALGAKVAIVERNLIGGDCLNVGCVPSKLIIRSSRVVAESRDAIKFGLNTLMGAEVDFPAVMQRMRRLRARISYNDSARRFQRLGVDVFLGGGRFTGSDTIEVSGKTLRFKRAVVATGARPFKPPIEGLADVDCLTNETIFRLTDRPGRLMVIGGGPVGVELAQAFCRLGCEVTIVEMSKQLLPREDQDAAQIILESLRRDGVDVLLGSKVKHVLVSGTDKLLSLESGGEQRTIATDEILVGAGRAPNVCDLDLETVGVQFDEQEGIMVNDHLQTTNPRIYAAGDVCMRYKFTHTADAAARIVIQNTLFLGRKKLSALTVPWCTYTDPEIAHVGMYQRDANDIGLKVDTFKIPMSQVDRAIADSEEEGFVKVHVKRGSDKILGATIVARHAGEIISEITLAMVHNIGLGSIGSVIHPYPTQAEAIKKTADAYNRTRLTPFVRKLFVRWLSWTR